MAVTPFPNSSTEDLKAHLAELDEFGITIVADVLTQDQLQALPAIVDRAMAVRLATWTRFWARGGVFGGREGGPGGLVGA